MKERIIVVPSSLDLAKTLAYHHKTLFNTRIMTPVELAQESLMRSGHLSKKEFVSRTEEPAYYYKIIKSIPYFRTSKLSDIRKINATINTIRQLVAKEERQEIITKFGNGYFKEKNLALCDVYEKYITALNDENKTDTIGLIREVIANAYVFDGELLHIREYPLLPLDLELLHKLSDGTETEISLFDLFETEEKAIHISSYKNCYGSSNEVASIIDDIYRNRKADQCVVACADYSTYTQIFYDYATGYDIPICFGNGLSIINSYPGKLLQQYHVWSGKGNFGWKPFFQLICSPYFNLELFRSLAGTEKKGFKRSEFWNRVSRLRLTNDKARNAEIIRDFKKSIARRDINGNDRLEKYLPGIEIVADELALPIEEFLKKYLIVRKDNEFVAHFDEAAIKTIRNELMTARDIGLDISDDVIETILKKMTYRQPCEPGHLYVCPIEKAGSVLRNELYICGLSSISYPGTPKENPLLLDCDLHDLGNTTLTSEGMILQKRENLFSLVKLASALGNGIHLSFPGLNVSELKRNNASSLIFELYKLENGPEKEFSDLNETIEKVAYFEPALSASRRIGEAYNESEIILNQVSSSDNDTKTSFKLNGYSPSQLNTFFNCKKQYLFQYLLKIPQPDDYDPYEVISATEQGTLAHALMEYLPEHPMSRQQFAEFSATVFDEYMHISVPLITDKIGNVREEFVEMMENGWEMDHIFQREVAFKEEDKQALHDASGVTIHGYPDRVEFTDDKKAVIIDFKTERDLYAHLQDDIDSCLQVIMYAYIVEKTMGCEVDHCEYRMLRFNAHKGIITCKYDDEIKSQLTEKLLEFRRCMEEGDFDMQAMTRDEEKERCKYCKYGFICGKIVLDEESE
ncbi:MAG: PD-(D/E)XK nuclease family protein [Erysipelotrichaceae bacterium]|nr:PD-(D/E)XK nuclease family protein [Erysipelotrichaceae bacterium]